MPLYLGLASDSSVGAETALTYYFVRAVAIAILASASRIHRKKIFNRLNIHSLETLVIMQIDVPNIIEGYAHGYFLMADDQTNSLGWYASRQRALIPLDDRFRYPKSLQRLLNQERFKIAINRDFAGVVEGCANRETTWISSELKEVYFVLHEYGWAHSFETWQGDTLAGGILGIVIGGAFVGESMFYNIPDASKVAMVKLVERLRDRGFLMFDAQMNNPHLERFGAYEVELNAYQKMLKQALNVHCQFV